MKRAWLWMALAAAGCAHQAAAGTTTPATVGASPGAPARAAGASAAEEARATPPRMPAVAAGATSAPGAQAAAEAAVAAQPASFKEALGRARQALAAERYAEAEAAFAAARPLAASDDERVAWVVYAATVPLARGDLAAARRHYEDAEADFTHAPPHASLAALMHNSLTWVRHAAGDHDGALVENECVRATVENPGVDAATRRSWLLHYWWDRAYLLAEAGRRGEAEAARAQFDKLGNRPDDRDSRAVLAAWLAVQRGDGKAARAAAATVDLASDGDVQDLYVLVRAFDLGGDAAAAAKVRAKIAAADPYPMKPLIQRLLAADAARAR